MKTILLTMTFVISASFAAWGDAIPYPDVGTVAPTSVLSATATGDVTGYFYGFNAADSDEISMCDLTASFCTPFELDNLTTTIGMSFDFGAVTAGDILVFNLLNQTSGYILSSDPTMSVDSVNHAYATAYTGGGPMGIPNGTFIGMEDERLPGSDLDYNDTQFVFTNLSINTVPEPSLLILCVGLAALVPIARRKFVV
jgi:hypothetical protein